MKDFVKIESLLKAKSYDGLSADEKVFVDQELSQETYEELRTMIYQLRAEKLKVSSSVKQSLMTEFRQQESKGLAGLFSGKVPAWSLLAPLLLLFVVFYMRPVKEVPVMNDRIVEVMVRDTIQVIHVDTLWKDRIVEVPKVVYVTRNIPETKTGKEAVSRSLGEQKEVMDLVVRGQ